LRADADRAACLGRRDPDRHDQGRRRRRELVKTAPNCHGVISPAKPSSFDLVAKTIGQTPASVRPAVPYLDRQARVDVGDVLHQIAWFKSQGMLKATSTTTRSSTSATSCPCRRNRA
jgi:hypothetical protein